MRLSASSIRSEDKHRLGHSGVHLCDDVKVRAIEIMALLEVNYLEMGARKFELASYLRNMHWCLCRACTVRPATAWCPAADDAASGSREDSCRGRLPSRRCVRIVSRLVAGVSCWQYFDRQIGRKRMRDSLEKVLELLDTALGPAKSALRVTQIGHDESVLPGTVRCSWAAQVAWRRRSVVDAAESATSQSAWPYCCSAIWERF